MMATNEEIEKLKKSWLADPCWDIEDTKGFEENYSELLAFHQDMDIFWTKKEEERIAKRAKVMLVETGISNQSVAQNISTYEDIEVELGRAIRRTESNADVIAANQVRATLLLAAQLQRIADALDARNVSDEAESNQDFMTRLYKVE